MWHRDMVSTANLIDIGLQHGIQRFDTNYKMDSKGSEFLHPVVDSCSTLTKGTGSSSSSTKTTAARRRCWTTRTRVVQKLIETLSTQEQISLVVIALEPGFLDLIKDLNGNHVIQRCLQCLSTEDNKFIFDAAAKFCVDIATHRHGCCVLQRCIDHSNGEKRQKLITGICSNGLLLAQDPFGNYVVQYILEKKIATASAQLVEQFEDHFVHLSMQKFSSMSLVAQ